MERSLQLGLLCLHVCLLTASPVHVSGQPNDGTMEAEPYFEELKKQMEIVNVPMYESGTIKNGCSGRPGRCTPLFPVQVVRETRELDSEKKRGKKRTQRPNTGIFSTISIRLDGKKKPASSRTKRQQNNKKPPSRPGSSSVLRPAKPVVV